MKLNFKLLFIILTIKICNSQSTENKEYNFQYYPSFKDYFTIKLNSSSNIIEFEAKKRIYIFDSINSNGHYQLLDYRKEEKISKFLPKENVFSQKIDELTKKELIVNLEKLCSCENFIKKKTGLDGTTFIVFEGKNNSCRYWQPENNSEQGKLISEILDTLLIIYENNSDARHLIFNAKDYFQKEFILVKNENPLYIKLYKLQSNCENIKSEIAKLPISDEIYIDITNYKGINNKCFTDELSKKYKNLIWIQYNFSDKFNPRKKISEDD